MNEITAIRKKGQSTDRFVVEVDGESFATLNPELLVRFSLHVGDVLAPDVKAAVADEASALSAYDRAVRMLASRGRPREDLRRRVVEKGEAPVHAARAVERLAAQGLLDDAAFARQLVRTRAGAHGRRRLAYDLSRQGIARDVASAALDEVLADRTVDAAEALDRLVAKKARTLAKYDAATRTRRITAFLARRGFGSAEIRSALVRAGVASR